MSGQDVQLVVFDLGGVVVRICRSWHDVFDQTGIAPDAGLIDNDNAIRAANVEFECGRITFGELIRRAATVAEHCREAQLETLVDAWLIEPYVGVDALINRLRTAAIRTACLSNTNARHWRIMTDTDRRYAHIAALDMHVTSHAIGVMKPDPGAYEAVEHRTGLAGNRIVFFDDSDANVAAAADRGWHARLIDHTADPATQMTDHLRSLGVL